MSLTTASILFAILLAITVFLSLKQQAIYLAILALGMAYAAPLVIPQYRPDVVFLFSYYLVINLAVAAVNFIQPWKILNQIAFSLPQCLLAVVQSHFMESQQNLTH